ARRQIAYGLRPSSGRSRKRTVPVSATSCPLRMLKNVVLPAPFGPMSARISPCGSVNDTSSTAWTPPNDFRTCATSSTELATAKNAENAAREDQHQRDEDHAEHHLPVLRVLRDDGVEDLVDRRADRRADERLDAAEQHHHERLDGARHREVVGKRAALEAHERP